MADNLNSNKGWAGPVKTINGQTYAVNPDGTFGLLRLGDSSVNYAGAKHIYGNGMYADFGGGKPAFAYKNEYRGHAPGTVVMADGGSWLDGRTGKYGPQTISADGPGGARYAGSTQERYDALNAGEKPKEPSIAAAPAAPGTVTQPTMSEEERRQYEDWWRSNYLKGIAEMRR